MRVALVYRGRYQIREALDLETLAAVLRAAGHALSFVYDPDVFGVTDNVLQVPCLARLLASEQRVISRIVAAQPDVVLFSVLPATYGWARRVAAQLKAACVAPIVFFGLHPSLVPERVMRDACVDYAIQGEVEAVIGPLLDALGARADVGGVGNLWYRRDGAVCAGPRAPLVDLDALPLPDKELFRPHVSHSYSYVAMVSRGCPFRCSFCEETCSKQLYGARYFRRKRVETVLRELAAGKHAYGFREVIFKDSYLSGNIGWLTDLMARYRAEIGVPFKCFCTILDFDEETARLLKQGGCYGIEFGLQTWNARIRREILHRAETNEAANRAFAICAQHGLWYDIDHMFNLPGECEADHREGAYWYRRLQHLNRIKVHHLVYLPTAQIVAHARDTGKLPEDVDTRLADGWATDFYDQAGADRDTAAMTAGYAVLYKLLPGLPGCLFRFLLRRGRVRLLRWLPAPLIALLQGLLALRSRDLRFAAYLRGYPAKVWRTISNLRSAALRVPPSST